MSQHRCLAILNRENLTHNARVIKSLVGESKIMAMLKANAYGHGIRSVYRFLSGEVDIFGVSSLAEGLIIKNINPNNRIVLLQGVLNSSELETAIDGGFEFTIHSPEHIEWLKAISPQKLYKIRNIWFKVNTGMNRLGFSHKISSYDSHNSINLKHSHDDIVSSTISNRNESEAQKYYDMLTKIVTIKPIIFSHFACADNISHLMNKFQIANFNDFISDKVGEFSLNNSAGVINFPDCKFDYVRTGLMLYGISPVADVTGHKLNLKPVLRLKSILMAKQKLKKGETLGYGSKFFTDDDLTVGIIGFGYGDGYKFTTNNGYVYLNGHLCRVIGSIAMDMTAVDISGIKCSLGDEVILIGDELPVEICANHLKTHSWDIVTSIQNRVKFIWI